MTLSSHFALNTVFRVASFSLDALVLRPIVCGFWRYKAYADRYIWKYHKCPFFFETQCKLIYGLPVSFHARLIAVTQALSQIRVATLCFSQSGMSPSFSVLQGRSQEFGSEEDITGDLRDHPPAGSRDRAPVESWG